MDNVGAAVLVECDQNLRFVVFFFFSLTLVVTMLFTAFLMLLACLVGWICRCWMELCCWLAHDDDR